MDPSPKCKAPSPAYSLYQREVFVNGAKGFSHCFSIHPDKLEISAKQQLSGPAYSIVAATAGVGWTDHANREAFYHWRIIPRVLVDTSCRDLTVHLFGHRLPAPILFAPIGLNKSFQHAGEAIPAKVAGELGLPYVLATTASSSIEEIAKANDFGGAVKNDSNAIWRGPGSTAGAPKAPRFFQLYMGHDDEVTLSVVNRAWASGYDVLMLTVDAWQTGWRPEAIDHSDYPHYSGECNQMGQTEPVFLKKFAEEFKHDVTKWVDRHVYHGRAHVWEKLRWLIWQWRHITGGRPVVLKGILTAQDALKALEYGCDGIVVSNHGGRQIDGAVSALDALPEIVEAVKGRMTILFDSGIRTGADIFKAMALGADAVMIGRLWVYGMAHGGERGVRHVVKSLLADLDITMTVSGYRSIKGDVNASALKWHPTGSAPVPHHIPNCKL
ncbi:hypothetical protein FRB99_002932 [Tulasnella sp. 403]|nr:hypothetical protein FRB99_002932 [Tulasnella sp. 403]